MNPTTLLSSPPSTFARIPVPQTEIIHGVGDLYLQDIPEKGRGVFSGAFIRAGETIEVCPVLVMNQPEVALMEQTMLQNYCFDWAQPYGVDRAFPLGFGMLYNHSYEPNARYLRNPSSQNITFVALCDIPPHQEILVNYNGDPYCLDPLFPHMRSFKIV